MSAYANDPRVFNDGNPAGYDVDDFKSIVFTNDYKNWWTMPSHLTADSAVGPFTTADEAIHFLIGDPQ